MALPSRRIGGFPPERDRGAATVSAMPTFGGNYFAWRLKSPGDAGFQHERKVTSCSETAASIERSPWRINLVFIVLLKPILDAAG
jgi:hypothetical protein